MSHSTPRDEIYIDDEGLEGSGGRGEVNIKNLFAILVVMKTTKGLKKRKLGEVMNKGIPFI